MGWMGDGLTCTDVDECSLGMLVCGENEQCLNAPGDARCVCALGFVRDPMSRLCVTLCGNGAVDMPEMCDDGMDNSNTLPNACRLDCTLPTCGDGVIDDGEACDDGMDNGAVCGLDCQLLDAGVAMDASVGPDAGTTVDGGDGDAAADDGGSTDVDAGELEDASGPRPDGAPTSTRDAASAADASAEGRRQRDRLSAAGCNCRAATSTTKGPGTNTGTGT